MIDIILKSKYTWFIGILIIIVTYYQLSLWNKSSQLAEVILDKERIELNLKQSELNFGMCTEVNLENNNTIYEMQKNLNELKQINSLEVQGKIDEISTLKKILTEGNTITNYPSEVYYNDIIKIKEKPNEEDITYSIISDIGK